MVERGMGHRSWSLSTTDVQFNFVRQPASTDAANWFGPLDPVKPLAPVDVAGRQWDYPAGYNLAASVRVYDPVSFGTLRSLADGYDLLRLVIETRKDQVSRCSWIIRHRNHSAPQTGDEDNIASLTKFFFRPDGIHCFADWLRILLEEMFVTDTAALYKSRDRGGRLTHLMPLDGTTIKPVIDPWGRTPQPFLREGRMVYPVAYQQVLKGYPAIDYSARDLIYRPRNIRVNRVYGFGPVEQIITTVNIALRRQLFLLDYFTEGTIPDSLIGVPDNWTPDQIASYQTYWDAYFDNEAGRRRRAKFVPGGVAKTFIQTKEPELKSPFDEWLARIVCFAFSISPQYLISEMNRATADTQKQLAEEEGLMPVLHWIKSLIDDILTDEFESPHLEFVWNLDPKLDPALQETILSSYTSKGILTINEARAALGRQAFAAPVANTPMALSPAGYVPLSNGR